MLGIKVIKRDGSAEQYEFNKVSKAIMSAAASIGGDDWQLADDLASQVTEIIETNGYDEIDSDTIQQIIEKVLIKEGHAATAKEFILRGADRKRMRDMNSELMKSYEEITFASEADSEVKRENANIDSSTAMGTMLKYGSEGAKAFNLMYLMSDDVSSAHANGDIHIHDLDFLSLTETCISCDTKLIIRYNNKVQVIAAKDLEKFVDLSVVDKWANVEELEVYSNNAFVKVKGIVKHSSDDKHMMRLTTPTGDLYVTSEHVVSTLENDTIVDKKVTEINEGDVLCINNINTQLFDCDKLDIINEYQGENLCIANTCDVILNIKSNGNWKKFCEIFDYRDKRAALIRSNSAKLTIKEYKMIEHLCTLTHENLKVQYKRSRSSESINGVIPLNFELGNVIGLMYTEGSLTEHESSRQESPVKKACFCNYDKNLIEQFNTNYSKVFNNASIADRKHKGLLTGTLLSGYLQYELFHGVFGTKNGTDDIRLADWMYSANEQFVSGLLAGIIDGDGCVQKDGYRVAIGSISLNFLKDLQKLMLIRGITSCINKGADAGTVAYFENDGVLVESIRGYDNYKLEITGDLDNKLTWVNSNKINQIDLKTSNKFPYRNITVTSIEEVEYSDFVYDIETEGNHFTADGFNVHNCCQIPLDKLYRNGFNTGHGYLREPGNIRSAGALAAIAIQSNQNDQHGGQSIPMFDYYLAPYVALSYAKNIAHCAKNKLDLTKEQVKELKDTLVSYQKERKLIMGKDCEKDLREILNEFFAVNDMKVSKKKIEAILSNAYDDTYDETYQSMEAFIHNLNTMHSRAGAQVPFSSINYGTDTSVEGRMVMETLLLSTEKGLGNGEIPIFPIQIVKMKNGVNMEEGDPNYDIFKLSCRVSAKRLYPNYVNLDAPYNAEMYVEGRPETEMATMGCVEESEIIKYKIGETVYTESFKIAYIRLSRCGEEERYSENSVYINLEGKGVKVYDSVSGGYVGVKKIIKNTNVNNWRVVTFSDGYSLTATGDHPLPIIDKGRTYVDDIEIGDKLRVASVLREESDIEYESKYFGNDAWLLGALISKAIYTNTAIDISKYEKNVKEIVKSKLLELGYKEIKESKVEVGEEAIEELVRLSGASKKSCRYITSTLLRVRCEDRVRLLAGIVDGNGYVKTSKGADGTKCSAKFVVGSTYKHLAMTMYALIRSLGYRAKAYRNKYATTHNRVKYLNEFEITMEMESAVRSEKVAEIVKTARWLQFRDIKEVEVVSIKEGVEDNEDGQFSYDLETESDRLDISYLCSHNCRTRVGKNIHDPNKSIVPGRGNLSFTSINLPRLGLLAQGNIEKFFNLLDSRMELVHKQLLQRFELQCQKRPINYPFLMGQGCWIDSEKLGPNDDIREVLKNGTLTVGFIGLAETLVALIGKHHGESEEAQKLGLQIVGRMRQYTDIWSEEEKMNYSVIGTPAEGLSGRFVRMDKKLFGNVPGVTDRDYYTNSSHVPVYYDISAYKKIEIEAPYHELENGGHIMYIEMDGDPMQNIPAFEKLVKYMHKMNAGYISINHSLDMDICGYIGIIGDVCPRCGRKEFEPMTLDMWYKIKGYANAGNAKTLGYPGDRYEEEDRLPNSIE